jgi:hypothetical protein
MAGERPVTRLLAMMSGLIIWTAQFTAIYGITAVACARGYGQSTLFGVGIVPLAIAAATSVAFAICGLVLVRALGERRRRRDDPHPTDRFLQDATILISGLSLVAIAWQGLPALCVPSCP